MKKYCISITMLCIALIAYIYALNLQQIELNNQTPTTVVTGIVYTGSQKGQSTISLISDIYNNLNQKSPPSGINTGLSIGVSYFDRYYRDTNASIVYGDSLDISSYGLLSGITNIYLEQLLLSRGFSKNLDNIFTGADIGFANIGYTSGNIYCSVFVYDPNIIDQNLNRLISCVDISDQLDIRTLQQKALKDLGLSGTDAIMLGRSTGDWYVLYNHTLHEVGGYMTYARYIDGKYISIFVGQDVPSCEDINKNNIPSEIINNDEHYTSCKNILTGTNLKE